MIRVALIDTSVPGLPGSMGRYRDQLAGAIRQHVPKRIDVTTVNLGCDLSTLDRTPARLRMWRRHLLTWRAARSMDVSPYDVIHLLDGSFAYLVNAFRTNQTVVTVHDVIPRLQMDGVFPGAPGVKAGARWLIQKCLKGLNRTGLVCADSQSTADDLDHYQCRPRLGIRVVPLAIESELFAGASAPDDSLVLNPGINGTTAITADRYLFHLGNNGFYKNRRGAIEVLRRISPELGVRLVLAGPEPDAALQEFCQQSGVSEKIQFVVNPNQQTLAMLYRNASVFLFPSLYEGFGWPPLEAMAVGCPVVASDSGSLPEVVGNAGVIVSTGDYDAMANACQRFITELPMRQAAITNGFEQVQLFSTNRLAHATLGIYEQIVQSNHFQGADNHA